MSAKGSLFGAAFGGLNYRRQEAGEDLVVSVSCNLNELYMGVAKVVTY